MSFDFAEVMAASKGQNFDLYAKYINPQMVRVLRSIGFDRFYERGEGASLWDDQGRRYLDFLSGFGVFSLGRSHPVIKKAIHDAIDADLPNLVQMDAALLPGILAQELLARCAPEMGRVFFTNSGTEAVESALKFARAATGRSRVLYCDHAFHGLTLGSLSLNGGQSFRKGFGPLLAGFCEVAFGDLDALARELRRRDVAAFVIEPVQGKTLATASAEYWDSVQELCRANGTLLIVDEVQSGLGRTGKMWAHEHWGVVPDIITVSKALSGGLVPVGAMICRREVSDKVYSSMQRAMVHSSTFGQNHLAMVAGLATLSVIDDEHIVDRARIAGDALQKGLAPLLERYELFCGIRGKGAMIGLEFGEAKSFRAKLRFNLAEAAHKGLFSQLIVGPLFQRHGILTQVAGDGVNVVKLLPPLTIGQEEVDYFVESFDDVLAAVHKNSALLVDFGATLAKATIRRNR